MTQASKGLEAAKGTVSQTLPLVLAATKLVGTTVGVVVGCFLGRVPLAATGSFFVK